MVRTLTVITVLLAAFAVAAGQETQRFARRGDFMVYGSADAGLQLGGGGSASLSLSPGVVYFWADNFGAGLTSGFSYEGSGSYYGVSGSYRSFSVSLGPRLVYYYVREKHPVSHYFNPSSWMPYAAMYIAGNYGNVSWSNEDPYLSGSASSYGYVASAGLGLSPLVDKRSTMFVELGFKTSGMYSASMDYLPEGGAPWMMTHGLYLHVGFGAFLLL